MYKYEKNRLKGRKEKKSKGKVLVVASVASMIDQFNIPNIRLLISMGYETDVACNFYKGSTCTDEKIKELLDLLKQLHADCYQIDFERNAADFKAAFRAFRQLDDVMKGNAEPLNERFHKNRSRYTFVHAHSPIGGAVGRIAAKHNHVKCIYTAHGFHFYDGAPVRNWLFYYPAEWLLSYMTDILITINRQDYRRAQRKLHAKKVVYIPGVGVDTAKFGMIKTKPQAKRTQLGMRADDMMILSVGELNENKNHAAVIRAMALLKEEPFFEHIQYMVCGTGSMEYGLKELSENLGIGNHVRFLGFRPDISDIYACADIFIFLSKREGLPASLMEAMASGLPVICSDIRGNTDLVKHHKTGFICSGDEKEAACLIKKLACSRSLRRKMGAAASMSVRRFDLSRLNGFMNDIYGKSIGEGYCRLAALLDRWNIRKQYQIPLDAFVLISAGELNRNKNHKIIIEMMAEIQDDKVYCIVCGRGKYKKKYEKLIQKEGLEGRVILTGFQRQIITYYHAADAFILPSKREGLGMAALEAMSEGLPLITSDAGGITDYSKNGVTGYVIPKDGKIKDYVHAVKSIKKKQNWIFYSQNAMSRVLNFEIKEVEKKMAEVFASI